LKKIAKPFLNPATTPNKNPKIAAKVTPTNKRNIVANITVRESASIKILPNAINTSFGLGSNKELSTIAPAIIQTKKIKNIDNIVIPVFFKLSPSYIIPLKIKIVVW
jgi:hypothetical protein